MVFLEAMARPFRVCIINNMPGIVRTEKKTVRLTPAEEEMLQEICRRTGLDAAGVFRQSMLEKGERMGIVLGPEDRKRQRTRKQ